MDVFVVPVAAGRYELYCEVTDEPVGEPDAPRPGLAARLVRRFHAVMADAERERQRPHDEAAPGWTRRVGRWILRHVAEAVAEQRLLWHLRRQVDATLIYPDDLTEAQARDLLRRTLARDRERHRSWLAVDAVLAAITGPLFFFVPGPNLVAYYFVFRAVGHSFAWRGARRGLDAVRWRAESSAALTELRGALRLPPDDRARQVRDVADRLRLQHLAAFVDRVVVCAS